MRTIDINADVGEACGVTSLEADRALLRVVTSVNIACGFHAGDPHVMAATIALAREHGVRIGAHPGYPDRLGFGRRLMVCTPAETAQMVLYQIGALQALAAAVGGRVSHVKLHGALYHEVAHDRAQAQAVTAGLHAYDAGLVLFAPAGCELVAVARAAGLRVCEELFADRAYGPDGRLIPRSQPGSVLSDGQEIASQVVSRLQAGAALAACETCCVHGDHPGAVATATRVRDALTTAGFRVAPYQDS
jgi:UPF0271 protein